MRCLWLVSVLACTATPPTSIARFTARGLSSAGLSGSTQDDRGVVWAVAERRGQLFRFAAAGDPSVPDRVLSIAGIPRGLELESMAWLDARTLALGTEADWPRTRDDVLVVHLDDDGARVVGRWTLSWSLWSITAPPNAGIEGLCSTHAWLVAGGEPTVEAAGARWAPVARMARRGRSAGAWTPFRLRLTTSKGKLSSLDCWLDDDDLEVYAIERHYGIARVLRFELPTEGQGGDIVPTMMVDLAALLPDLPNLEGLARRGEQLVIVSDHDVDDARGATETILLGPFDDD